MGELENDLDVLGMACAVCEGADIESLPSEYNSMALCEEHMALCEEHRAAVNAAVDMTPGPMVEVPAALPVAATPMEMVGRALQQGITGETLQQFMDLQERYEANEARKAYAADMAKAQAKMEPVVGNAENDHTKSTYAKLGHINRQIKPIYTRYGFSVLFGFGTAATEGYIRTTARVLHKLGHFEEFWIDLPPDAAGLRDGVNKTAIHAHASSNTYGQRYIIKGIFNLSLLDEDDDGNAAGGSGGKVDEDQAMKLNAVVKDWEITDPTPIMREFGIDDWAKLPAKKFEKAVQRINVIGEQRRKNR